MDYEAFVRAEKPVQRAAFTASLTQYRRLGIPLLCVGDERTTRDVVALLQPDSAVVTLIRLYMTLRNRETPDFSQVFDPRSTTHSAIS